MSLKEFYKGSSAPTALALIAANCVPLAGAIFFNWSVFAIVFVFWLENVIIGMLNIVRFLGAAPPKDDPDANTKSARIIMLFIQLFFSAFFTLHYGMFCFVHGIFVIGMFGSEAGFSMPKGPGGIMSVGFDLLIREKLIIAALAIFISHSFSLVYNYFIKGERYGAELGRIMGRPYGRIVVLHITIILGAGAAALLGSPVWALALMVTLKIAVDLKAHLMERKKMAAKSKDRASEALSHIAQAFNKAANTK